MNNLLKTLLTPSLGIINPFSLLKKRTTTPAVPYSMTGTGQIGPVALPNTNTNKVVNPRTGGITTTPLPTNTNPSPTVPTWDTQTTTPPPTTIKTPAPTTVMTPTAPDISLLRTGVSEAEKAYLKSMQMTPEEEAAQAELDRLNTSFRQGYQGIEDQTIPMQFITGQQASLEKRALNLAEPLSAKLARLQAKRTSAVEASKFALERADKAVEAAKGTSEGFTLGEGQTRYDAFGNKIAGGTTTGSTTYTEGVDPTADAYVKGVLSGQYKLENIPENYRGLVAQGTAGKKIQAETSPYSAERAFRTIQSVNELLPQVNSMTTGFGSLLSIIPESQAKYFRSQINTLKSSIITNELTAMREASKTGGALGNVSDRESEFLSNALGALDTAVSPAQFKTQLEKIKQSVERWQQAVNQYGGTPTASASTGNTTGGVVQTSIGAINTNW